MSCRQIYIYALNDYITILINLLKNSYKSTKWQISIASMRKKEKLYMGSIKRNRESADSLNIMYCI